MLPLACGRATRLVRFLTASDKDYDATIRFGLTTDSYDVTGTEVSRSDRRADARGRRSARSQSLRGEYLQMPPAFSAKKVGGPARLRAGAASRAGRAAAGAGARDDAPSCWSSPATSARVALTCSAGFYVRSFAHALGELVGTGACLEALRRTRSGEFDLSTRGRRSTTCSAIPAGAAGRAVPLERLLPDLPGARLTDEGRSRVSHGQDVDRAHVWPEDSACLEPRRANGSGCSTASGRLLALGDARRAARMLCTRRSS